MWLLGLLTALSDGGRVDVGKHGAAFQPVRDVSVRRPLNENVSTLRFTNQLMETSEAAGHGSVLF